MLAARTIAVVIPAYNEARLLPRTLRRLPAYVDRVVVVDDASADQTASVVADDPRVTVLRHEVNRGVGAAIVTGYRWCMLEGLDVAVVMGADDQMHPDDMPALLLPLLRGEADYVCGDRLAWPGGWREFPWVRLAGVVSLAALTRWSTGLEHVRDAQCGYTAITCEALGRMALDQLYPRYGFPNDMLAKAALADLRVTARPIRPIYADETSAMQIQRVIGPLLRLSATNWLERRLRRNPPGGVRSGLGRSPARSNAPGPPYEGGAPTGSGGERSEVGAPPSLGGPGAFVRPGRPDVTPPGG